MMIDTDRWLLESKTEGWTRPVGIAVDANGKAVKDLDTYSRREDITFRSNCSIVGYHIETKSMSKFSSSWMKKTDIKSEVDKGRAQFDRAKPRINKTIISRYSHCQNASLRA
jgi:hypothetical protein